MIVYLSGTGNSLYAAKTIAHHLNDRVISVTELLQEQTSGSIAGEEYVGMVFPVHAWGPPSPVLEWIDKILTLQAPLPYLYAVITCGENVGNAVKLLDKHLIKRGLSLKAAFSVVMPNNFIIVGDVYEKSKEDRLLAESQETLTNIAQLVKEKKEVRDIRKGRFPGLKTAIVYPLFARAKNKSKKFRATDACTGCGICERVCPTHNITVESKPQWNQHCILCLACIHRCPERAIEYGKSTIRKGRYVHPTHFH
jgi:NAD-dependent dihydropyrimidine dehydrogenase PreA subunit/flavodoxin